MNIAIADPLESGPIDAARDITGLSIEPVIALEHEIENEQIYILGYLDLLILIHQIIMMKQQILKTCLMKLE